jgi:hypothetical protein
MFLTKVLRQKSKFSSILFLSLMLVAASFSYGAFDSKDAEKRYEKKLAFVAHGFKSIISGAYFSPAATFTVNNNGDSVDVTPGNGICADADGNCTLRAAIQEANASAGIDLITFDLTNTPATIQLNASLSPAELAITETVTINGPGARLLTISGNVNTINGVFKISSPLTAQTSISGITIDKSRGHGINNEGRLSLTDVSVKTNKIGINNSGRLIINRATISSNTGNGIYLAASSSNVNISNSTITNNLSATSGGGIHSLSGDVTLNNVTISHNNSEVSGGGIYYNNAANGFYMRNTIVANNTATTGPDILALNANGKFVSRGNNLIGKSALNMGFVHATDNDKVGTLTVGIDPVLGLLQNNGGATDTRAISISSPAIDAGNMCVISSSCPNNSPSSVLSTDQRGTDFPRIYDGTADGTAAVDIGAFEAFYPMASISSFVPNNWGTGRGAFELVINGTNFVAGSQVKWNGQNRVTIFVSNTQIKAQILAGDTASAGQFPVTVVNPAPGGGTSEAVNFPIVNCAYSINPTAQIFPAAGGSNNFAVTAVNGCAWTAITDGAPWLSIVNGSNTGTGNGTVAYTVAPNNGQPRTASISVGGQQFSISQSSGCTYSISPTSANNISATGVSGSFTVMPSNSACGWTAQSSASWITVSNQSGTSSGTINYTVAPNTGPVRTGTITVNGEVFNISQLSGCSFAISSTGANFPAAASNGSFNVTAGNGCAWTATSSASWLKINSGATGSGNGSVLFTVEANNGAERSATITVNGQVFTVNQASGCVYTLSSTSASNVPAAATTLSVNVTVSNGCAWSSSVATASASWITITSGASGSGNGTVNFTIAANTGLARAGTLTIAGQTFTVNQLSGCTFTLSPTTGDFDSTGGTGTINVTTNNPGCTWTATATVPWITINSGSPGDGNGTITYTVQANVTPARTGKIIAGDKEFTITQSNGCSYSLPNPPNTTIPAAGGNGSFTINTGGGCPWTPISNVSWVTITSNTNNIGSDTVNYTVAANNGPPRSGTITVGGKTYTINQENGCTFILNPTGASNVAVAGGTLTVTVTASNIGCAWTGTVAASSSWITITGNAGGTGNGSLQLTVAANTGPARTGTVTIGNQAFTVTQANGCVYSLTPNSLNINESGGDRSFNINTGIGCTWTVASNAPWITILSGAEGEGSKPITLRVEANTGSERTGTITAGGQTFTVYQLNLIVSNLNDDGAGSLRRAIANANAAPGNDVVSFQSSLNGTITLTSGEIMISSPLEIKGLGADLIKISGNNASRIFYANESNVTIKDLTLTKGNGAGRDSSDDAKYGGAIYVYKGSLMLSGVSIFQNVITGSRSLGGGIYIDDGGMHRIENSTIAYNSAPYGAGGIFNRGELKITNSTITGNVGDGYGGGGIHTTGGVELHSSTITGNSSNGVDKGAGLFMEGGAITIRNTIIAGNNGSEISVITGSVSSAGNNLIGDAAGDSVNTKSRILYQPSDILDTQPMLSVLENFGGRTFTMALLPGSPAINAGNGANAPQTDQRGAPRIVSDVMDIGAFEQNIVVTPSITSLPNGTVNTSYSQIIEADRIGAVFSDETFRYSIVAGYLPNGLELIYGNGIIQGTIASKGTYTFTVRASGDDGMAGVNKYTIAVGCSYTINPVNSSIGAAGGSGTINLTTPNGCTWTAVSSVPWITIGNTAAGGTGNGSVPFTVAANTGAARSGTITVGGKTFTVNQSGECAYNLSSSSANVPSTSGTASFTVNTGTGCSWAVTNIASWLSVSGASSGSGTAAITVNIAANSGAARTGTLSVAGKIFTVNQNASGSSTNRSVKFDYDGDGKSDMSVFRPETGVWHLLLSQSGYAAPQFGLATDKLVPADYDGDGKTDLAVFRENSSDPAKAKFYVLQSSNNQLREEQFGSTGDIPVAGDWDGDRKTDVGVYRAGTESSPQSYFYYRPSSQPNVNFISYPWGSPGDKPVVADYDNDGKADQAVFRPATGEWFVQRSTDGFYAIQFGAAEDKPVVGDYDGDGKADQAVFRPSNGVWYLWKSRDGFTAAQFGVSTDLPAPADYDGDGKTDMTVYRNGGWFILNSNIGFSASGFGVSSDKPVPNSFIP